MIESYSFTAMSRNSKLGRMPSMTASKANCPDACPLKDNGCYAGQHYLGVMWDKLSHTAPGGTFKQGRSAVRVLSWADICDRVADLPGEQIWRGLQAGDLPHDGGKIDRVKVLNLALANQHRPVILYTHHLVEGSDKVARHNRRVIMEARARGLVINLSANSPGHADKLKALGIAPVVCVLPEYQKSNTLTPDKRAVVVCPAVTHKVTCKDCRLCSKGNRTTVIGFPAHGAQRKAADKVAKQ